MTRLTLLWIIVLWCQICQAQDGIYSLGAQDKALAGASTTLSGPWSAFNNAGAMGSIEETAVFATYQNRYQLPGFHVIGGGMIYHNPHFNTGIKYFKFGDDLFSQQKLGMVLANKFQLVSLGVGINIVQTSAEGFETEHKLLLEFGGLVELTDELIFGAHLLNIKHRKDYPTVMKAGISYLPFPNLSFNLELEKQFDFREKISLGLEYRLIDILCARTGFNFQGNTLNEGRVQSAYGLGFIFSYFRIDYAFSTETPGASHELSIIYTIKKS